MELNEFFYGTPPQDTQDFSQVLRGVGRSIQDIGRGVSYYPYDLLGSGVDVANMGLGAIGLGSERPVLGSDYLRNIAQSLGLAQPSTGSGTETAARFASALINPAAGARAVGRAGSEINRLVSMIDETPPRGSVQIRGDVPPITQAPSQRQSFVEGVPAGQELIVHHNISPEKLSRVQKVGGMPVPSIAVSNVDNPLSGFGDISLIGNPSMANPSAKNPVFGFDAYTARAPNITYKFDSKSEKNLTELFADVKDNVKTTSISDLVDEWRNREFNDLMRAKFLSEKGILPNPSDFKDKYDFSRALGKAADENYPEYRAWVNDFDSRLAPAGVNIQEKIFKGFTQSGNRRYAEANLENLVKEMKGGAGSEGINYGVGNLRAVATPKFRKLDDIKASREKIIPKEEFAKVKDNISEAYFDLSERIAKLGDQQGYGYRPEDVLYDIGQAKNVNLLDRFKTGADDQLKADIGIFIRKLQKLPTEYFEIKPQRAVQVSEFEGAIVPVNAPESSINYLRDQGIERIHFYSTPEERTELFKKFGDKMFGVGPAVGAGLLGVGMSQDEQMF